MRKMKICWISNIPSPYKTALMNLIGQKADLICLFEKTGESDRDDSWYDRQFRSFSGIYLPERDALSVIRRCAGQCDCLIDSDYSNPLAMYAAEQFRKRKKPVFMHADGGLAIPRGLLDKVISAVMKRCDHYLSPGFETDRYYAYYGIPAEKISHYRFACMSEAELREAEELAGRKAQLREKLGMKEKTVMLSVGQQIPRKGYDILVPALQGIEDCALYIIGGEPEEHVRQYAEENGMTNVHFIPFMGKDELKEYYAAADLFVLATRYDIWGLVINEAMAYGLPVVATDRCVAAAEFNGLFHNCLIVPAEDKDALHAALVKLAADGPLRDELGKRSLAGIRGYSLENMADDLTGILHDKIQIS